MNTFNNLERWLPKYLQKYISNEHDKKQNKETSWSRNTEKQMTSTPFSFNSCLVCFIAFSFSAFKPALQYGGLKNINIITIKHALGISAWENQVWWNSKLQWKRTKKCFLFLKHLTSDCNLCFVLTSFSSLFCCSLLSDWSCESCESYWERSFVRASSSRLYEKQRKSYQSLSPAIHVIAAELKLWTTYRLRRFSPKSLSSSELRKQYYKRTFANTHVFLRLFG